MQLNHRTSAPRALALTFAIAALLLFPSAALAQPVPTGVATAQATAQATAVAPAALTLSSARDAVGASITANGTGFKANETVDVTFNGTSVGSPVAAGNGAFSLSFTVPQVPLGTYGVLAAGRDSKLSASTNFQVVAGAASITLSVPQAAAGTAISITATGFTPGEVVTVLFNGAQVGTPQADPNGTVTLPFTIPSLSPGTYVAEAHGGTSGGNASVSFTVLASSGTPATTVTPGATPAITATAAPTTLATPTPVPSTGPVPTAPAVAHDERYFQQTGYRVDSDQVWGFFNDYGGVSTFGYPVSRMMTFLGCPVQMFQALIIQICGTSAPALINMLDPDIFPYTQVNGSTFPAADQTMKNNTPPVSDPNYAANMNTFINTNVPDTWQGQPVNFLETFNTLGGLTIWGAPISQPAADPANANFVYQRFQRGIMHFDATQNVTQRILLADYLKAILMNQNVPPDLLAQSKDSRYFAQYCPGKPSWLCRPADLGGTDLTFAFEKG